MPLYNVRNSQISVPSNFLKRSLLMIPPSTLSILYNILFRTCDGRLPRNSIASSRNIVLNLFIAYGCYINTAKIYKVSKLRNLYNKTCRSQCCRVYTFRRRETYIFMIVHGTIRGNSCLSFNTNDHKRPINGKTVEG